MKSQRSLFSFLCCAALLCLPCALLGQAQAVKSEVLQKQLTEIAASFPGQVGFYVKNVETGVEAGMNADHPYPMASTYKVPIMVQVFRDADAGKLKLDERVTLTAADKRLGSGLLNAMAPGLNPTIHDLMLMMITVSDNEATDILLNKVGAANVTATMKQLGIENLRVDRTTEQIIGDYLTAAVPALKGKATAADIMAHPESVPSLSQQQMDHAAQVLTDDPKDHASPRAMGQLLEQIVKGKAASEKSCQDLQGIMQKQEHRQRISRYMEERTTATKSGTIGATTNDVGILYLNNQHIIVSVFTVKANAEVQTGQAEEVIGRLAKVAYDYFDAVGTAH